MAELQFAIGSEVRCRDEVCGDLTRVVVDPLARAVTHLVVEPRHRTGLGRLVPIDLVDEAAEDLRLLCSVAEFDKLDEAEETKFLPGVGAILGYGQGQAWGLPFFGLGMGVGNAVQPVVYDRVPVGEVEVRRGEQVHATDGAIGKVQGLVIDPEDHHVTHVLLQEGHLWGRREVAIPITAVTTVKGGIHLSLTKDEVQSLPAIAIDDPARG